MTWKNVKIRFIHSRAFERCLWILNESFTWHFLLQVVCIGGAPPPRLDQRKPTWGCCGWEEVEPSFSLPIPKSESVCSFTFAQGPDSLREFQTQFSGWVLLWADRKRNRSWIYFLRFGLGTCHNFILEERDIIKIYFAQVILIRILCELRCNVGIKRRRLVKHRAAGISRLCVTTHTNHDPNS